MATYLGKAPARLAIVTDDSVTSAKIVDNTVTSADILNATITGADLASDITINTTGTVTTSQVNLGDNEYIRLGASQDLQLYHDASHSYIKDAGTGDLRIEGNFVRLVDTSNGGTTATFASSGVNLRYSNSVKLTTTSTGATVTGTLVADGLTVDTNTFFVDSTNNKVGILASSTPTRTFEIGGDGTNNGSFSVKAADGSEWFRISSGEVAFNQQGGRTTVATGVDLGARVNIGQLNNSRAALAVAGGYANNIIEVNSTNADSGGDVMVIDQNGNVGIGTTSPSSQLHISGTDITDQVIIENTDANSGSAPDLVMYRNSASPAVNDILGRIDFRGKNDGGTSIDYGSIYTILDDETAGTEDGSLWFQIERAGGTVVPLKLKSTEIIVNDNGVDTDFRVESVNNTNMLHVNAGNDRVGIGGIPAERLSVIGPNNTSAATLKVKDTEARGILIESPYSGSGVGFIGTDGTNSSLGFKVNSTEYMRIDTSGRLGIGTTSPGAILDITTADTASLVDALHLDNPNAAGNGVAMSFSQSNNVKAKIKSYYNATTQWNIGFDTEDTANALTIIDNGNVGIGTTSPSTKLDVNGTVTATTFSGSGASLTNIPNGALDNSSITINGSSVSLGGSATISAGTDWQAAKTSSFTAVAGEGYFINTTSGAITMTLPASPSLGDEIRFVDLASTFDTNNLTIGRNGNNINGAAADLVVSTEDSAFGLVYSGATYGWKLIEVL